MIHAIEERLIEGWEMVIGDRLPRPRRIHFMKFGSIADFPRDYVYLYAFLDGAKEPALVLKITANRTAQARLIRQVDLIHRVRARLPEDLLPTVPEAIAGLPMGEYWIGVEECAGGERFLPVIDLEAPAQEASVRAYMHRAMDWAIRLAAIARRPVELTEPLFHQQVTQPLRRLRSLHTLEPDENRYLEQWTDRLAGRRGTQVVAVASHGDLWPGNIYVRDGGLRVIDWGGYDDCNVTHHDLYCFLDSFDVVAGAHSPARDRGDELPLLVRGASAGWFGSLAAAAIAAYTEQLELDTDWVELMLPLYYVTMATRREPVNEASVAVNYKFRRALGQYVRLAQQSSSFHLPGPWTAAVGEGRGHSDRALA